MKVVSSIVKIDGDRIALVAVQKDVLEFSSEADQYVERLGRAFDGLPVILFGQDEDGGKYYGDNHLVSKFAEVDPKEIPWKEIELDL